MQLNAAALYQVPPRPWPAALHCHSNAPAAAQVGNPAGLGTQWLGPHVQLLNAVYACNAQAVCCGKGKAVREEGGAEAAAGCNWALAVHIADQQLGAAAAERGRGRGGAAPPSSSAGEEDSRPVTAGKNKGSACPVKETQLHWLPAKTGHFPVLQQKGAAGGQATGSGCCCCCPLLLLRGDGGGVSTGSRRRRGSSSCCAVRRKQNSRGK